MEESRRAPTVWLSIKLRMLAIAIGLACGTTNACRAQVFSDSFGPAMHSSFWHIDAAGIGPTLAQRNDRLIINFPSDCLGLHFSAGYQTTCLLRGDFDIRVNFSLIKWPAVNGIRLGLQLSNGCTIHRVSLGPNEQSGQPRESYYFGGPGMQSRVATSLTDGSLRLSRINGKITGYYTDLSHTGWVTLGTCDGTGDLQLSLMAWSEANAFNNQPVELAFQDFQIDQGTFVFAGTLNNISTDRSRVLGGHRVRVLVESDSPAPPAGTTVEISSSAPDVVSCPSAVTIPAFQKTTTFLLSTANVTTDTTVRIMATQANQTVRQSIVILAPEQPAAANSKLAANRTHNSAHPKPPKSNRAPIRARQAQRTGDYKPASIPPKRPTTRLHQKATPPK